MSLELLAKLGHVRDVVEDARSERGLRQGVDGGEHSLVGVHRDLLEPGGLGRLAEVAASPGPARDCTASGARGRCEARRRGRVLRERSQRRGLGLADALHEQGARGRDGREGVREEQERGRKKRRRVVDATVTGGPLGGGQPRGKLVVVHGEGSARTTRAIYRRLRTYACLSGRRVTRIRSIRSLARTALEKKREDREGRRRPRWRRV
mmetsp:Transcript_1413/g.5792  ORF Transcript_1413/g.5792 Transcript_1413/m.5792 type:complete len:208 (-) Transcript_1413:121-744(-)